MQHPLLTSIGLGLHAVLERGEGDWRHELGVFEVFGQAARHLYALVPVASPTRLVHREKSCRSDPCRIVALLVRVLVYLSKGESAPEESNGDVEECSGEDDVKKHDGSSIEGE